MNFALDSILQDMPLDIDWFEIVSNLTTLSIAYLLAFPIGWDRERRGHSAGLRTFPLVSVATCGYMLIGISVFSQDEAQARVAQGLLAGIGFIGGGAIIKNNENVHGLATASAIWSTGAIGIAVAFRHIEIALLLMVLTFFTLRLLEPFKARIRNRHTVAMSADISSSHKPSTGVSKSTSHAAKSKSNDEIN